LVITTGKTQGVQGHIVDNINSTLNLLIIHLKQKVATIDCATNQVKLNERKSQHGDDSQTELPILAKETVAIQPFALIPANAHSSIPWGSPDFQNAGCITDNDKEILNGIVSVQNNNTAQVKLINTTYEPRYVHKGDILGYITVLENPQHAIKLEKGEKGGIKLDASEAALQALEAINNKNARLEATQTNQFKTSHIRPSPGKSRPPQVAALNSTTYPKMRKQASAPKPMSKLEFLKQNLRVKAPAEYQELYWKLVDEFQDVFSETETDLGLTPTLKHSIKLKTDAPVHVKQYTIPFAQRPFINKKVKDLLIQGIVEKANSAYNTPCLLYTSDAADDLTRVLEIRLRTS